MSSRAYRISLNNMEKQNIVLEMKSRNGAWYMVDLSFYDDVIAFLLTNSVLIEDMLSGREVKLRRGGGVESTFRFAPKRAPLPLRGFDEMRH